MKIEEDDLVLCTVKKIEGTTVFVGIEGNGEGSVVFSEIAAGRIRNIRDYVSPNKKIVCKVLKIRGDRIELSLRRVTAKERDETIESNQKEKAFLKILAPLTPDPEQTIQKIRKDYEIPDFLEKIKENPELLESFLPKKQAQDLLKILSEKKEKEKTVKKTFSLSSSSSEGLKEIKEILDTKEAEIKYLGSSKFSLSLTSKNPKEAEKLLDTLLKQIESKARQKRALFSAKEK